MKVIFKICDQLIPIGNSPTTYDTPVFDANCFAAEHVAKIKNMTPRSGYHFEISGCAEHTTLYEMDDCRCGSSVLVFDSRSINFSEAIQNQHVILSEEMDDELVLTKYKIVGNDFEFCSRIIVRCDESLQWISDDEDVPDIDAFFSGSVTSYFEHVLRKMVWRKNHNCIALKDCADEYLNFIRNTNHKSRDMVNLLKFWYYISEEKFCYLFEFTHKQGKKVSELASTNPVYTGVPYTDVRAMAKLSNVSMNLLKRCDSEAQARAAQVLERMERNHKIGVNGIKLIEEINDTLIRVKLIDHSYGYETNVDVVRPMYLNNRLYKRDLDFFQSVEDVVNTFDISIKTLMERAIRAIFNENVSVHEYLRIIQDYIRLRTALGLPAETKLPKNVIELHDTLSAQLKDVKSAELKMQFAAQAPVNAKLSNDFNATFTHPELTIIAPICANDMVKEGQDMHHCVGSYVGRVAAGYSKIYFVRKKSNPDLSFVTIELDNANNLIQARARFNGAVDMDTRKYIEEFVAFAGGNICD